MYIDVVNRIKNAQRAGKPAFKVRYTNMDYAVLEVLRAYGFIKKAEVKGKSFKRIIEIDGEVDNPIHGIKFLSTPSLRRFAGYDELRPVKNGHGVLVLSTPKGILSGAQARKQKVGGQLLFQVW